MNRLKFYRRGLLYLIAAQSLVGLNIVCSKQLVSSLPILMVLTIRFVLATVTLLPLHWLTPASKLPLKHYFASLTAKQWLLVIMQALSAGVVFNSFMLAGLHHTDANVAGIITSTLPAIIAIMCWVILGNSISKKQALCILFATLGLGVIALGKLTNVGEEHTFFGDFLVFLSLFPEALYYVLGRYYTLKIPVFLFSSLMNGFNSIVLIPLLLLQGNFIHLNISQILILLTLGISTGVFYVLLYFGSRLVDNVTISITTAVMPIATVLFAWLFIGEQLNISEFFGMTLVMISIAMYARR